MTSATSSEDLAEQFHFADPVELQEILQSSNLKSERIPNKASRSYTKVGLCRVNCSSQAWK